ncbi:hypothetical protein [Chryseobacterium sp. S90]|uniref:hypothetical protein n=1 Tax=Chryseobacterium sp. S90 TaxID=3395373 RepID=UPI0039BCCD7E
MKENFSLSRFKKLLAIDWQANRKKYMFIILAMLAFWILYGLAALWLITSLKKDIFTNPSAIKLAFFLQMFGFISFLACGSFTEIGTDTNKTSYILLLPNTNGEKFMAKFIITAILFWIVFFVSAFIGLYFLWNIFYPIAMHHVSAEYLAVKKFDTWHNIKVMTGMESITYAFFFHSVFTLGSIILSKFKYITTLLVVTLFYFGVALLNLQAKTDTYYLYIYGFFTISLWLIAYRKLKTYSL